MLFYTTQVWFKKSQVPNSIFAIKLHNWLHLNVKFKLDGIFVQELNSARVNSALNESNLKWAML